MQHKYQLQKPSKQHPCPACGKLKSFTRYIDTDAGTQIADHVGKCSRLDNCGHHYPPRQYFHDNGIEQERKPYKQRTRKPLPPPPPPPVFIPVELLKSSVLSSRLNTFTQYLERLFGSNTAAEIKNRYYIGTGAKWNGCTVFWYIDREQNIRYGKIMLYHEKPNSEMFLGMDIKRDKEKLTSVVSELKKTHPAAWITDYENQDRKISCLFGEHLLAGNSKPVYLFESEKTATIAAGYFPDVCCLATGGQNLLTAEKLQALSGRTVVMFPDLKSYDKWKALTHQRRNDAIFEFYDGLETTATDTERTAGLDFADYLLTKNPNEFREPNERALFVYVDTRPPDKSIIGHRVIYRNGTTEILSNNEVIVKLNKYYNLQCEPFQIVALYAES